MKIANNSRTIGTTIPGTSINTSAKTDSAPQVLFGTITQFKRERNYGIAVVDYSPSGGMKRGFSLSTDNGPFLIGIKPDSSFPVFAKLTDAYPPKGAKVVLEVSGVNGDMRVSRWGCAVTYWKTEAVIKSRRGSVSEAVYRVIRDEDRFMGKKTSARLCNQVVFEGKLRQLEVESRRDGLPVSMTDKFAPTYMNELCTSHNRFIKRQAKGEWASCEDPRPFPATGPIYRLVYRLKDETETELAIGQALRINLQFPRGKNDPLTKYINDEAATGGYLYWLRQDSKTFSSDSKNRLVFSEETIWVETNDPRPLPAKAKPAKVTSPVLDQPRPVIRDINPNSRGGFRREFHGLEALSFA